VDPRVYPRALRDHAVCELDVVRGVLRPDEVLHKAWRKVAASRVVGSCTACILTLDNDVNQLAYANLGDSGIVVLRAMDRALSGSALASRSLGRTPGAPLERQVVLVASQQLRAFNLPYQLGYTDAHDGGGDRAEGDAVGGSFFETPAHANVASFPVLASDIVIVGSDGLFDNVSVDDIAVAVSEWEPTGAPLEDLARILCEISRERSLDDMRDSPFALLAKENDILWSGGMPDDVTVVALRVDAA